MSFFRCCLLVLLVTGFARAVTDKTCQTSVNGKSPDTQSTHVASDDCHTYCYDCLDHTICNRIMDGISLIESNDTFIANLSSICSVYLQPHQIDQVPCSSGALSNTCYNPCPRCHDLDMCEKLVAEVWTITHTNLSVSYPLYVLGQHIMDDCETVHTNAAHSIDSERIVLLALLLLLVYHYI